LIIDLSIASLLPFQTDREHLLDGNNSNAVRYWPLILIGSSIGASHRGRADLAGLQALLHDGRDGCLPLRRGMERRQTVVVPP